MCGYDRPRGKTYFDYPRPVSLYVGRAAIERSPGKQEAAKNRVADSAGSGLFGAMVQ
jgi:hypothetical protein